ncbi:MAG: VWA domain-containing protein, partial [Erysipelotrichaceae bacterium]|nr:VWA domain-containing protein [Erysipelotrichaceae bacterium]
IANHFNYLNCLLDKITSKLAAIILSLSMIFSLTTNIGTTYAADTSASAVQITDSGGSDSKDGVTVSKTITGTDQENVFDITLTVETTQSLEELYEDPDMAIVIVMDISNSMTSTYGSTTRYDAAVSAASSFIDQFAEETMGISQLGFVAFNSDAYEVFGMRSCSSTSEATDLKNTMSTYTQNIINRYSDSDYYKSNRFTNIEAGLKMASDMLAEATNENKYIIFLSDGFPTTYIETGYEGYDTYTSSGTPGTDGVFFDYATGYYCSYGTSYSDKAAIRARQMATSIKESGTEIFSIGIDVGGQTIDGYERYGVSYSVIDRTSYSYEIGSSSSAAAFKNWLKGTTTTGIGSGYYYDTTDADALASAFTSIFTTIKEEITAGSTAQWVASDPLPTFSSGSDTTVEFIGFYDLSKNLTTSLTGSNVKNGENTASYSSNSISWDLKNSGYTTSTSTSGSTTTTTYTYSLTYRVRLQNESSSFAEDTSYATNGDASLSYIVTDSSGNETSGTIDFPVPEVKGYLGELTFTKVDQNGDAVKGAVFTLSHDTSTCDECRGDGSTSVTISDMTATSDENGTVSFTNIPSGHTYTLTETSVPDGYVANNSTYSVVVAYGVVTVTEKTNGTSTTWSSSDDYTIVNYELDTPEKDVLDNTGTSINGDMVKVGETLTYAIDYTNNTESEEKVVVTDKAPEGTSYVANSAKAYIDGTEITDPNIDVSADGTITWTVDSLAAGSTLKVSFDVLVEDTAQSLDKNTVVNDALVTVDNDYELTTNTVTNDVPEDPVKDVVDDNGDSIDTDMVKVGDTLTYTIDYKNDTKDAESVVVTDKAPEGTSYVANSAKAYIDGTEITDPNIDVSADGTITWTVDSLAAGSTLKVSFDVLVEDTA